MTSKDVSALQQNCNLYGKNNRSRDALSYSDLVIVWFWKWKKIFHF